jgi:hypothetical protein
VFTLVFGINQVPFTDPVALGHQLRESFTHILVSVPPAWGVCLFLKRRQWSVRTKGTASSFVPLAILVAGVLLGIFLVVSSFSKSAASQGQTDSLLLLIFPHFFEHTFSYVVACLAAGFLVETMGEAHAESGQ